MNKIWIIARREFLSRVQKKTFLYTTILLPIVIFGLYGLIIYFSVKTADNFKIAIADNAKVFGGKIDGKEDFKFLFVQNESLVSLKEKISRKELDGYVWVPEDFNVAKGDTFLLFREKR